MVELSRAAFAVVCGLVANDDDVQSDAICAEAPVWEELRRTFPVTNFRMAVQTTLIDYLPDDDEGHE